jgi:peptide/nickel transport system substrate-binding protein
MASGSLNPQRIPPWIPNAAAAILVASLAWACGGAPEPVQPRSPSPDGSAARRGTAVLGLTADLDSLNPYLSVRAATRDVAYNIYASLLEEQSDFQDGPPSFAPDLAERWEADEDGRGYIFHLRPDARWSDGVPITAADVHFTQAAAIHPDVAWLAAEVKKEITSVEVVDDHTVHFRFTRSYPYQLMDANDGVILPAHVWSAIPYARWREDGPRKPAVVSGPFTVVRWVPGQTIELAANENFYDQRRPRLQGVVFRVLPDAVAGFEQFMAGHLDFWDRIDPRQMERVTENSQVTLHRYPDRYYGFIGWNCSRDLFRDPAVRQALTLAIDRRRITADIFHGVAEQASGPFPPVFGTRFSRRPGLPHDPQQAARLLEAAGWVNEGDGSPRSRQGRSFVFELQVNADAPYRRDIALLVQEDLRRIGVEVKIVSLERRAYGASHRTGEFDAYIGGWRLPTKLDLGFTFSSQAVEGGANFGRYRNPELDAVLARAAAAPDYDSAAPALEEALDILQRDQPYTFLYWQDRLAGTSVRIQGAHPNAQSALFRLSDWSINEPPEL